MRVRVPHPVPMISFHYSFLVGHYKTGLFYRAPVFLNSKGCRTSHKNVLNCFLLSKNIYIRRFTHE